MGAPFVELLPEIICSMLWYQQYMYWLLNEKVKKNGGGLSIGTISDYVRGLLNEAKKLHGLKYPEFFQCLIPGSESWLKQMLMNGQRVLVKRCLLAGDSLQSQASSVSRDAMILISQAYARIGTMDAILRSFM